MKNILIIEKVKMLWKVLTNENYVIVSLDEWNENAIEWYNEGIRKGIELSKEQGVDVMEDQATEC